MAVERGSLVTSVAKLANDLCLSPSTVRRWLKAFEDDHQIRIKTTNKYTQIFVINYGKYQDQCSDSGEQIDEQTVEQTDEQIAHNRRNKEIKKEIKTNKRFSVPNLEEVRQYITENHLNVNADRFYDYYSANGWKVGRSPMKDWKASCRYWSRNETKSNPKEMPEYTSKAPSTETASAQDLEAVRKMMEELKK